MMADEVTIPTRDEIAQLPRWAKVAFAARCARRVLPLFKKHWPDAPQKLTEAIFCAVNAAEMSASNAVAPDFAVTAAAENAADAAHKDAYFANHKGLFAVDVPVARAAGYAVSSANDGYSAHAAASEAAFAASLDDSTGVDSRVISMIRNDFNTLLERSRRENWTDDTPVPPSVFGPLPPEVKKLPPKFKGMALRLLHRPNTPPQVLADALVELWEAANEYHMAAGGGVLTFDEFEQLIGVPVLEPVGAGEDES